MMVMFTIAAIYAPTTADPWLRGRCRPRPWSSHLGGVPLTVVRSGDPPPHSRGRHRCRWATSRNRCYVGRQPVVPPVGSEVLSRRSPRHPAPPTAPDSSPWPPAGRGRRATARSSEGPDQCSLATSRRWVHRGLGPGERWAAPAGDGRVVRLGGAPRLLSTRGGHHRLPSPMDAR